VYFDDPEPADDLNTITIVFIAIFAVAGVGDVSRGIEVILPMKKARLVTVTETLISFNLTLGNVDPNSCWENTDLKWT
jgi:hypothetical protein